jgi:hypothetical protein
MRRDTQLLRRRDDDVERISLIAPSNSRNATTNPLLMRPAQSLVLPVDAA